MNVFRVYWILCYISTLESEQEMREVSKREYAGTKVINRTLFDDTAEITFQEREANEDDNEDDKWDMARDQSL